MDIGERIKFRREFLGFSQDELAQKTGYKSHSSINKIEIGAQRLTQPKIMSFAVALRTTPAYLMGWEEQEIAPNDIICHIDKNIDKLSVEQQEELLSYFDFLLEKRK